MCPDIVCALKCFRKPESQSNRIERRSSVTCSNNNHETIDSQTEDSPNGRLLPTAPPIPAGAYGDMQLLPTEITTVDTYTVVPSSHFNDMNIETGNPLTGERTTNTQNNSVLPSQYYSHTILGMPSGQCHNANTRELPPSYDQHSEGIESPDTPPYNEIDPAYPMVQEVGLAGEVPQEPPPSYCDL